MARIAVVLFNLGGPDRPESIQPFLFNLFNDPAILRLPMPLRWCLAQLISRRRAPIAAEIYQHLGGRSPLLEETRAQAAALEAALADGNEVKVFTAMRYWHPLSAATAAEIAAWSADEVVLLPLYPQYSSTTSASSFGAWQRAVTDVGLKASSRAVCCFPTLDGVVEAQASLIAPALKAAASAGAPRLLFSAHGLPEKIVAGGDPYQWQVERTAAAIAASLDADWPALDWRVCYQSRVGPLKWIGPETAAEIERAGRDGVPLVVAPVAFVSEHSETLVELDIEYRALAERSGVPAYHRVPALGTAPAFIAGLAALVREALARPAGSVASATGGRLCPTSCNDCAMAGALR